MNWDQVKGNWKQLKGKAKQMWGDLTDEELDVIEGNREELAGRLQAKYGLTKEQAEEKVDDWVKKLYWPLHNLLNFFIRATRWVWQWSLHTLKIGKKHVACAHLILHSRAGSSVKWLTHWAFLVPR